MVDINCFVSRCEFVGFCKHVLRGSRILMHVSFNKDLGGFGFESHEVLIHSWLRVFVRRGLSVERHEFEARGVPG